MMHFAMSPDNLLFFCSVTASVAAAFALFSLYRHLAHRRPHQSSSTATSAGASSEEERLPLSATLPPFMYDRFVRHSGKGVEGWTECAVCLGVIQVGAMAKLLPGCSHVYHCDCIDLWLASRSTCPLCRCRVELHPSGAGAGQDEASRLLPPASSPAA